MVLKIKTVAGLLLVIIACLVVGMLGYTVAEGLTPATRNARPNREHGATNRAQSRRSRATNRNANTQVGTSVGVY